MHRILDEFRTNDSREFFSIQLHKVITLLEQYEEDRGFGFQIETPYADLFATFPDDGSPRELTQDERVQICALEESLGSF